MTAFLKSDNQLWPYMALPRFLLEQENLNETAKMVYVILLNRARLFMKNGGWTDQAGNVFLFFPIKALAEVMHKSEMTIKNALRALEKEELILRVKQGLGHPNRIYVKVPDGQTENCPLIITIRNKTE